LKSLPYSARQATSSIGALSTSSNIFYPTPQHAESQ
jgi:hypothetical protein